MQPRTALPTLQRPAGRLAAVSPAARFAKPAVAAQTKTATAVSATPEAHHADMLGNRAPGLARPSGLSALSSLDGQQVRFLQSLQRHYGNDHVARVIGLARPVPPCSGCPPLSVQLAATACPAPPKAPESKPPQEDPKFKAVESRIHGAAADQKKHPSAKSKVAEAQGAAVPPANDTQSQAQAAQADKMGAAKPGVFDKAAFIAAVNKAIADASPKTLDEADKFASSGKAGEIKNQVMDEVTKGKDDSAKEVKEKTGEAPDPSAAKPKPVTPMAEEKPGPKPPDPAAASGMPSPAPADQTNLDAGKCETDQKMADAEVTEDNLKKSNEPQMQQAVEAKKEGEEHSAKAPEAVKAEEAKKLQGAESGATSSAATAMDVMHQKKTSALGHVGGDKGATKAKDEAKRAEVSTHIDGIFTATKAEVDGILTGLDTKVSEAFTKGEAEARKAFEENHKTEMQRWKDQRYSGITGAAQWLIDKVAGPPPEANDIYMRARNLYLSKMNQVIADVADIVGGELTRAKNRINQGREEIKKYVAGLGPELKKFGAEAERNVASKFEDLDKDVDAKKDAVVSDLAQKYVEARNSVDESIKAMQDENKSLWDKAKAAVGDAVEAILKLKDLFMGLLAKAASAFTKILNDPLTFIGNFMTALKTGFMNFASNILEHLKKGLMGWLFGALAEAGIEIPETFDFKGILKLILSILGLTWPAIKAYIAKAFPWAAKVIDFIESKVEIIMIIVKEGVGGLWKYIKEKISDLKDMILAPIKEFVITKIVTAGIQWVLGMLNPAGALIKIIQALIGVVQWIMERGAALMDFVSTVIDAVSDIAAGGMGGVPAKIEGALSNAVPLVISFLAGLLGLGGISDFIKKTLDKVRGPVMKVVHAVVGGAVKAAKPLIKGAKAFGKKVAGKVRSGVGSITQKAKQKASDLRAWVAAHLPSLKTSRPVAGVHTLAVTGEESGLNITVASKQPRNLGNLLDSLIESNETPEVQKKRLIQLKAFYTEQVKAWKRYKKALAAVHKLHLPVPANVEAGIRKDIDDAKLFIESAAAAIVAQFPISLDMAGDQVPKEAKQLVFAATESCRYQAGRLTKFQRSKVTFAAAVVYKKGEKPKILYATSKESWSGKDMAKPPTEQIAEEKGAEEHAERKILARAAGYKIYFVASSNKVCSVCAGALDTAKARYEWVKQ